MNNSCISATVKENPDNLDTALLSVLISRDSSVVIERVIDLIMKLLYQFRSKVNQI